MLQCCNDDMEAIYCDKYFYSDGLLFNFLRVMHLTAKGKNYCPTELAK